MHDLVIRGGTIHDGTGAEPFAGDVAIDGDRIVAVGEVSARGREEIDASGHIVTPGFVDIHTHFDGQVTWDPYLSPSTFHGVTTVVMGNCGVGFAPCAPERHGWLIQLMEGVEDIPGTALAEGIRWNWESFPEYMDAVEASPLAIDVGLQIPHGALRGYVMGDRAARLEPANEQDVRRMASLVQEAIEAGALGFSTSRTEKHRDRAGNHTPSFKAEQDELWGIAKAPRRDGSGRHPAHRRLLGLRARVRTHPRHGRGFGPAPFPDHRAGRPPSGDLGQRPRASHEGPGRGREHAWPGTAAPHRRPPRADGYAQSLRAPRGLEAAARGTPRGEAARAARSGFRGAPARRERCARVEPAGQPDPLPGPQLPQDVPARDVPDYEPAEEDSVRRGPHGRVAGRKKW